jgi:hypothetical protein
VVAAVVVVRACALVRDQSGLVVMRVLHVIPSVEERSGGPATAIVPMCRALRTQGIDVVLASTNHGFSLKKLDSESDYKGVPVRFFPVQFGESFKYSRPFSGGVIKIVRQFFLVNVHAVLNQS